MSTCSHAVLFGLLFVSIACVDNKESSPVPKQRLTPPSTTRWVGVAARDFVCETVFSLKEAQSVFSNKFQTMESSFTPPVGAPASCNYMVHQTEVESAPWSFDLDCRESAIGVAGRLFSSYLDAPNAKPLHIGQSALDHHDSALIFIDNDTPCYGRVTGPKSETRRKIAEHLVKTLTIENAPTGRHILKQGE